MTKVLSRHYTLPYCGQVKLVNAHLLAEDERSFAFREHVNKCEICAAKKVEWDQRYREILNQLPRTKLTREEAKAVSNEVLQERANRRKLKVRKKFVRQLIASFFEVGKDKKFLTLLAFVILLYLLF